MEGCVYVGIAPLTAEREAELAPVARGDAAAAALAAAGAFAQAAVVAATAREAKAIFVGAVVGMVHERAAAHAGHGIPFEDLVQEGMVGLMRAVVDFDPSKGRWSTHAHTRISKSMGRAIENQAGIVKVPNGRLKDAGAYRRARERLAQETARAPWREEIRKAMRVDRDRFEFAAQAADGPASREAASIDARRGDDAMADALAARGRASTDAEDSSALAAVRFQLGSILRDRDEVDVISFRVLEGLTVTETASRIRPGRMNFNRVKRIERSAMRKLRANRMWLREAMETIAAARAAGLLRGGA